MKFFKNYIDTMQTNAYAGEDYELPDESCEAEKERTAGFTTSKAIKTYENNLENDVRSL